MELRKNGCKRAESEWCAHERKLTGSVGFNVDQASEGALSGREVLRQEQKAVVHKKPRNRQKTDLCEDRHTLADCWLAFRAWGVRTPSSVPVVVAPICGDGPVKVVKCWSGPNSGSSIASLNLAEINRTKWRPDQND